MRVMLVDDSNQITESVRLQLQGDPIFDVTYALDPLAARRHLQSAQFDALVVDVLYEHLMRQFTKRLRSREVSLRDDTSFLISGLATFHDAVQVSKRPGLVLWAVGVDSRELHMLFAHQEFNVRAFSSKGPTPNGIGDLKAAILSAAAGRSYSDPLLEPYLPRRETPLLRDTFFEKGLWCGIWRALAMGVRSHDQIASMLDKKSKTIRNTMSEMADRLSILDPGLNIQGPSTVLSNYATSNWQFFLDDTVMRMFPPTFGR